MIKKILAISVAFFYLAITIGFPISIHHCHGQNEISIAISDEADCGCSTNYLEEEACCSIELADIQHCQSNHHEAGCCTHETKVVHFDLKQQLAQQEEFKIYIVEVDLYDYQLVFDNQTEEVSPKYKRSFISDPPPKTIPLQVLNHEFIFYG